MFIKKPKLEFLISTSCSERFWGEAAFTTIYTINRLPSSALQNVSPFERLYGTPSSHSFLHVFGSICFVLLQLHEHSKLEPWSRLCCFLGYGIGIEHKGYPCWDPISKRLPFFFFFFFLSGNTLHSIPSPSLRLVPPLLLALRFLL